MMVNKAKKPNVIEIRDFNQFQISGYKKPKPAIVWQLNRIEADQPCIMDNSGVYTTVHYITGGIIRIDLFDNDNNPLQSFSGKADNIRKVFCEFLDLNGYMLSYQHVSYIGQEITKAAMLKTDYIQD